MSKEVIRAVHGMVSRRVISNVSKDTAAYVGDACALVVDGVSCILIANHSLDLSKVAAKLDLAEPFSHKRTARVALVHVSAVKLADTGWEPQEPVQDGDYDPEDDEL